ncbi:hypothetical protein JOM56_007399 [Amanita muscaria]
MVSNRPSTSKPRGICKYYNTPRGCFAGDNCKFLHGDPSALSHRTHPDTPDGCVSPQVVLTPYDSAKICRYYANGYCKRGVDCWFRHVIKPPTTNTTNSSELEEEEDLVCSVCLEKPVTFGLLGGCSHVFCIQCIQQWRDPENKSGDLASSVNTKKCPMCRAPSKFITPSSRFWKEGEQGKTKVMQAYRDSTARLPCRYFQESKTRNPKKPFCPFGKDCFYQHNNDDGTKHVFKDGVDVCMKIHSFRRQHSDFNFTRRRPSGDIQFVTFDVEHNFDDLDANGAIRGDLQRYLDATLRQLERPDADELSLLRESLVENIALLLGQNIDDHGNHNDGASSQGVARASQASISTGEEARDNTSFMERLQSMVSWHGCSSRQILIDAYL